MANNSWQKPFLFSIFSLVLIGGLVVAGYFLGQKGFRLEIVSKTKPAPAESLTPIPTPFTLPTATPTLDPTADWEIYTNSLYRYQFRHPRGWSFGPKIIGDESKPLYVIRQSLESNDIDDYQVLVKVWQNPERRTLTNWLQFMKDAKALPLPVEDLDLTANTTVAGEPALKFWSDPVSRGREPGSCFQACPNLSVYFAHGDKALEIQLIYFREVETASQLIFSQLLSTFHFL